MIERQASDDSRAPAPARACVVLVRPQGPRNVGSVVRAIANFGPAELRLVAPERPSLLIHPDFVQMSHGVEELAEGIRTFASLGEALADRTFSVGFTARPRDHRAVSDWRDALEPIAGRVAAGGVALVFGSEENGLTGAETAPLSELVRIPTLERHTSINLATTVAIVLSTLFLRDAPDAASEAVTAVPGEDRRFLIERLKDALGGATRSASARRDLVASIERVFARAPLETRDARAWHLLARALASEKRPQDYGLAPFDKGRRSAAVRKEP